LWASYGHWGDGILKKVIESLINSFDKKTIQTDWLYKKTVEKIGQPLFEQEGGYIGFHNAVMALINEKKIVPIKASKFNGRNPALYNRYRKVVEEEDFQNLKEELYLLSPRLKIDYYLKHIKEYKKVRGIIKELNDFLRRPDIEEILQIKVSLNERSYQIFKDEKLLSDSKGEKILKNLGMDYSSLNCCKTYEPFFYILYNSKKGNKGLIVENKDTFYSIKRVFAGNKTALHDTNFNLLIYGEGKKILKSFGFVNEILTDTAPGDTFYYFGDIDYEGIGIFLELERRYSEFTILPFVPLYSLLINNHWKTCPFIKTVQEPCDIDRFLAYFDRDTGERIRKVLKEGRYVPQEALTFKDLWEQFS